MGKVDLKLQTILQSATKLTDTQIKWLEDISHQFIKPYTFKKLESSDLLSETILYDIGDMIRLHHCLSMASFSKDKFEFVMQRAFSRAGIEAHLAPRGNPGHDITINKERFSLKSEASAKIREDKLHISKFMELGKGKWENEKDLEGLRERFFAHMEKYDRILSLRSLQPKNNQMRYELVEIPKSLLLESRYGILNMKYDSSQNPKPGSCQVLDNDGNLKYQLYFDGGTERKLQIQHIRKDCCIVHGEWSFEVSVL
ncbi:hypothetical protein [Paenibacillus sp. OK003]|uniref:hypothetical protein n=1 Tax=Paenibacillus sp. OK003 TaxID=1884380 RepID=UPI0008D82B5F|nr:hypothetical protein [Paenibacillus sp. OK003]SEL78834.1 type II restriction enzyme [Paenibacillus sp. OK003]